MKIKLLCSLGFWILLLVLSCKSDDINFENPARELSFSSDALILDTVYSQVRSETYALKVYNRENRDVNIPEISLENGSASPYRLNLDGKSGTNFRNVALRKKDSLYIFVEVAPVASASQALAQDRILFETASETQHVTLLSVVQDAEFFIESKTNANIISENMVWNNQKVKIVYGKLTVAEGKTLEILPDTKIYFTKNSSLVLSKNATLNIKGDLGKEVILRGDRNDTRYDTIPLNWKGVVAEPGAKLNVNYAKIFGGDTALDLNGANANILNTVIHTFQNYGIRAVDSGLTAQNLVMTNFGQAAVALYKGSSAEIVHSTLANYNTFNTSLAANVIFAANEWTNASGTKQSGPVQLSVKNSIVYGAKDNGIVFKPISGQTFSYLFDSSLMKMGSDAGFTFENNPAVVNSIKNADPKFLNTSVRKMNLRTANESPARNKGRVSTALSVPLDIVKTPRTSNVTLGAYQ